MPIASLLYWWLHTLLDFCHLERGIRLDFFIAWVVKGDYVFAKRDSRKCKWIFWSTFDPTNFKNGQSCIHQERHCEALFIEISQIYLFYIQFLFEIRGRDPKRYSKCSHLFCCQGKFTSTTYLLVQYSNNSAWSCFCHNHEASLTLSAVTPSALYSLEQDSSRVPSRQFNQGNSK